jgi:hypothetical protein
MDVSKIALIDPPAADMFLRPQQNLDLCSGLSCSVEGV